MRALPILLLAAIASAPLVHAEEIPDSGDIFPDGTYSYTFTEVFEDGHHYHCHPHPWMWAMVHVFPEGTLSSMEPGTHTHQVAIVEGNTSDDWGYTPQHLSIEVGDTVVWTNTGNAVHTVSPGNPNEDDGHHHDHSDHDDHGDHPHGTVDTPGLAAPAAIGGLLLAAFLRRP